MWLIVAARAREGSCHICANTEFGNGELCHWNGKLVWGEPAGRQAGLFSHESTLASRELLSCYERLKLNLTLCLGHLLLSVMSVFLWHSWILSLIMCLISSINLLYVLSTWCFSLLTWFPWLCPHLWSLDPLVDTLIFSYHMHSLKLSHMWHSSLLWGFVVQHELRELREFRLK